MNKKGDVLTIVYLFGYRTTIALADVAAGGEATVERILMERESCSRPRFSKLCMSKHFSQNVYICHRNTYDVNGKPTNWTHLTFPFFVICDTSLVSTVLMELSSDEETWGSLRIDISSKKQIPEKRHAESIPRAAKKANIEANNLQEVKKPVVATSDMSSGIDKRNSSKSLKSKSSKAVNGGPLNPLPDKSNVKADNGGNLADKTIASSLPSNGVQGLCSKLKNSAEASATSTPICSPKSVKVKEIKHSERIVQAAIARYKPCK
jgi:hypothetical protein